MSNVSIGALMTIIFTSINIQKLPFLQGKVHIDHYKVSLNCMWFK